MVCPDNRVLAEVTLIAYTSHTLRPLFPHKLTAPFGIFSNAATTVSLTYRYFYMQYAFVSSSLLVSNTKPSILSTGKMFAVTKALFPRLWLIHACHKSLIAIEFGACSESQLHQH